MAYPGCCFCNGSHLSCVKPRWQPQRLTFLQFYNPTVMRGTTWWTLSCLNHGHLQTRCLVSTTWKHHLFIYLYVVDFVLAFLFSISNYCSKAAGCLPQSHSQGSTRSFVNGGKPSRPSHAHTHRLPRCATHKHTHLRHVSSPSSSHFPSRSLSCSLSTCLHYPCLSSPLQLSLRPAGWSLILARVTLMSSSSSSCLYPQLNTDRLI